MVYETLVILRPNLDEDSISKAKDLVTNAIKEYEGEVLVNDDWGVKAFAQAFANGEVKGRYVYFLYRAKPTLNVELDRRLKINDSVIRSLTVKLGDDENLAKLVKAYKRPGTNANPEMDNFDIEKDRKMLAKKKTCWFTANKTAPDWKDPSTYAWLVNEFGKISPARVTSISPKYQRKAVTAIKRGRMVGLISYMSQQVAN